jgi:hypothetical protein
MAPPAAFPAAAIAAVQWRGDLGPFKNGQHLRLSPSFFFQSTKMFIINTRTVPPRLLPRNRQLHLRARLQRLGRMEPQRRQAVRSAPGHAGERARVREEQEPGDPAVLLQAERGAARVRVLGGQVGAGSEAARSGRGGEFEVELGCVGGWAGY